MVTQRGRRHNRCRLPPVRGPGVGCLVTGGQSGVDRAATDVAVLLGIPYDGAVPRGGWAEDYVVPPGVLVQFPGFVELDSDDVAVRTAHNVDASDALLVLALAGTTSPGTSLAVRRARQRGIPLSVLDLADSSALTSLREFLEQLPDGCRLNVAGPRESEAPGIYERTRSALLACADQLLGTPK